jgi:integrase
MSRRVPSPVTGRSSFPSQTLAILKSFSSPLHFALVLTCAATALRSSEILALRWSDILWGEGRIRISKRWAKGEDGETKTDASDGYVPLHPVLAGYLRVAKTDAACEGNGFCFSVDEGQGQKPLSMLLLLSLTICDRQRKQPVCRSRTAGGSGFTTCGTAEAIGL